MTTKRAFKIIYTGLIAGFVSEAILGALFMSPPVQSVNGKANCLLKLHLLEIYLSLSLA